MRTRQRVLLRNHSQDLKVIHLPHIHIILSLSGVNQEIILADFIEQNSFLANIMCQMFENGCKVWVYIVQYIRPD